jgi:hypothetical protein
MGARVHQNLYDRAIDQLEKIVDADPDYEQEAEQEFIDEITQSGLGGFTARQVSKIERLYKKYVLEERDDLDADE